MIGKGQAISHTKASMKYGWNQEKDAKIVFKQYLAGETPTEITKEFKIIQSMNTKCWRNTFSFVLSPTIDDKQKLTAKMLEDICSEFIEDLKLTEHQAIGFVHNDKEHTHIHLYLNRINFKGKAYNDSYIGLNSQKAAERVARKLGLRTVKEVQLERKNDTKLIRKTMHNFHKECIKTYNPNSFKEYIEAMMHYNITVIASKSKTGKLLGFRYHFKNQNFKGSAVHRDLSINKVTLELSKKTNIKQPTKQIKKRAPIEKTIPKKPILIKKRNSKKI